MLAENVRALATRLDKRRKVTCKSRKVKFKPPGSSKGAEHIVLSKKKRRLVMDDDCRNDSI